jgi:hypothetical protein
MTTSVSALDKVWKGINWRSRRLRYSPQNRRSQALERSGLGRIGLGSRRPAAVAACSDRRDNRQSPKQRDAQPRGDLLGPTESEDRLGVAAARADKHAHILDHSQDRHTQLLEHRQAAQRIVQRHVLRRRDDDRAVERDALRQAQRRIAGAGGRSTIRWSSVPHAT